MSTFNFVYKYIIYIHNHIIVINLVQLIITFTSTSHNISYDYFSLQSSELSNEIQKLNQSQQITDFVNQVSFTFHLSSPKHKVLR